MKEIAIGAVLGAVGLTCISSFYHWLFFRPVLSDGQYGMAMIGNFMAGAILGAVSYFFYKHAGSTPIAAVAVAVTGSILVLIPLLLYLWLVLSNPSRPEEPFLTVLFSHIMFCLPLALWLLAIVYWIVRVLKRE
jgi:hypothetical protein